MDCTSESEAWKPITFRDGILAKSYDISDRGRIRSWKLHWKKRTFYDDRADAPKAIASVKAGTGYLVTRLMTESGALQIYNHVLVAHEFLGPRPRGYHINHKDFDKTNCWVGNLEYVLPWQNLHHRYGRTINFLTDEKVLEAFDSHANGETQKDIAKRLGVNKSSFHRLWHGINRPYLKKSWKEKRLKSTA